MSEPLAFTFHPSALRHRDLQRAKRLLPFDRLLFAAWAAHFVAFLGGGFVVGAAEVATRRMPVPHAMIIGGIAVILLGLAMQAVLMRRWQARLRARSDAVRFTFTPAGMEVEEGEVLQRWGWRAIGRVAGSGRNVGVVLADGSAVLVIPASALGDRPAPAVAAAINALRGA